MLNEHHSLCTIPKCHGRNSVFLSILCLYIGASNESITNAIIEEFNTSVTASIQVTDTTISIVGKLSSASFRRRPSRRHSTRRRSLRISRVYDPTQSSDLIDIQWEPTPLGPDSLDLVSSNYDQVQPDEQEEEV